VTIVTVTDEKQLPEVRVGDALAEHLSFQGIKATVVQVQSGGLPIGQSLQNQALASGADLLVMGGFGHSRIRDFVLGGATSGILAGPLLPALISH
jgi:nucleotide-binding universal stress UspA family protein